MKHFLLPLVFTLINISATCQKEPATKPIKYLFKMSPQHLTLNMLKVGLEKVNTDATNSIQLYAQVIANNDRDTYFWNNGYDGGGFELMFKRYLLPIQEATTRKGKPYTQGIYLGGFLQAGAYHGNFADIYTSWDPITQNYITVEYNYKDKTSNGAFGFTIGLQRIFWKVLALDAYVGAGYQLRNQQVVGDKPIWVYDYIDFSDVNYRGILPKLGLTVGLVL
jgi:hypothetical protein